MKREDRIFKQRLFYIVMALATLHPAMVRHIVGISQKVPTLPNAFTLFVGIALIFGALAIGALLILGRTHLNPGPYVALPQIPFAYFRGVWGVIGFIAIAYLLINLMTGTTDVKGSVSSPLLPYIGAGYGGPFFMSLVVFLSIVSAEVFFRAFWFARLIKRFRYVYALPLSALIYSLAHAPDAPSTFVLLFFSGLGYSLVYQFYGISVSILSHLTINGLILAGSLLDPNDLVSWLDTNSALILVMAFVGISLFIYDLVSRRLRTEELSSFTIDKMYRVG